MDSVSAGHRCYARPRRDRRRSREAGVNPARSRRCEGRCSVPERHWRTPGRRNGGRPEPEDLPAADSIALLAEGAPGLIEVAASAPWQRRLRFASGWAGACAAVGAFGAAVWLGATRGDAAVALLLATSALLVLGVVWVELRLQTAKELALIGTLGGLAAASRLLFHPLPNVMPMTALVIACGAALGPGAGATIGATAALVSNFVYGQGPWTPWQMLGWGLCGALGGLLRPLVRRRLGFAVVGALLAFLFGALQNLQFALLQLQQPHAQVGTAFATAYGGALSFDVAHAVATALVALAIGPELVRMLDRFARKLDTEVVWT